MNTRTAVLAVAVASLSALAGCAATGLQTPPAAAGPCVRPMLCFAVPAAASEVDRPTRAEEKDDLPQRTYVPIR